MSNSFEVEFVGGPLDGTNLVHPEANYILVVKDDDSGYYQYLADLRYHWIVKQSNLL